MTIALAEPRTFVWSRDEYYRLADEGFFVDRRVELIEGEIVEMPAQKNEHSICIGLSEAALRSAFGAKHWVRNQAPLHLGTRSAPEPDLSVVRGKPRDYLGGAPTSALLVVEVSDTSLVYDRGRKANLYAAFGIEDYWIINLVHRRVEVHRRPVRDDTEPFAHRYDDVTVFKSGDSIVPLAARGKKVAVADLLP